MSSNFKITEIGPHITLKKGVHPGVIDTEYHSNEQNQLEVTSTKKGVPLSYFKYKIKDDSGVWSGNITATININVDSNTPSITEETIDIPTNETTNLLPLITFNTSTDRFKITTIGSPIGQLYVNDQLLVLDTVYMIADINTLNLAVNVLLSEANPQTDITFYAGNKDEFALTGQVVSFRCTGNLQGSVQGTSNTNTVL